MKELRPSRVFRSGAPKVSLARALSKLGYCSRARAMKWIGAGLVRVNGRGERDASRRVDPVKDRIEVEGRIIPPLGKVYLMLNKPRGLVTTTADEKGRATVYACLQDSGFPWLAPLGRLDKASEGLLLFTNDSQWAAKIMAPETHLTKTYHVQVDRVVDGGFLKRMTEGVQAEEGNFLSARKASLLRRGKKNCWLEVALEEGKNRHIRRLLSALGANVLRLVRVAIGPLPLGNLPKGKWRFLTENEVNSLTRLNRTG